VKKYLEPITSPAISKPKRSIWSKFRTGTPSDVEITSGPVSDDPLTAHHANNRKHPWTRTHSHFALMGGFVFDADDFQAKSFMPDSHTQLTLTPRALRKLAEVEPMFIPDLSVRTIKDKSKANHLAKALACLQACWFIVQVIGRAATSAPISLLEMNTFLHALCCLIVYLAWWYKPLDIEEPEHIKVDSDKLRKICAWMIMGGKLGAHVRLNHGSAFAFLVHSEDIFSNDEASAPILREFPKFWRFSIPHREESSSNDGNQPEQQTEEIQPASLKLYPGDTINGFRLVLDGLEQTPKDSYLILDSVTKECLRLADSLRTDSTAEGIWTYNWPYAGPGPDSSGMLLTQIFDSDTLDDNSLGDFRGSNKFTQKLDAITFFWLIVLFAGSVYGLVHLIAWNGPFTSLLQRWTWRVSCLIIASPSVLLAVFIGIKEVHDPAPNAYALFALLWFPYRLIRRVVQRNVAIYSIVGPLALVYLAARVFLVVECFINISQLPPEVYQIPQWSQYIPHLGGG
jgi:hypothetical protein